MRIALFVPCFIDQFSPQVAEAVARLLSDLGHEVVVPEGQTCCGQPAFNAGHWPETRRVARHFIRVFEGHDTIVAPSGSCVTMVKTHYPQVFEGLPERDAARKLGDRIHEFTGFLVDVLGVRELGARFEARVTLHDSCHALRELGVREQPRVLLSAVAYTLMQALRRLGLHGTHMANARCQSIRLKLLKIGAVIIRNTRRVRLMLSSACPYQELFITVAARLRPT